MIIFCKHIPEYDQCCCSLYHSISLFAPYSDNPPLHLAVLVPSSGSPKEFRQTKTIPTFRPARNFFRRIDRSKIYSPQSCGLMSNRPEQQIVSKLELRPNHKPVETSNHPGPHSRLSFPSHICNIFLRTETSQLDRRGLVIIILN